MEKIEILRRAVVKAKNNGYFLPVTLDTMLYLSKDAICYNGMIKSNDFLKGNFSYYHIIFNHNFAKGIWGNDYLTHLQNMVILLEPLEYLEKFFGDKPAAPATVPVAAAVTVAPVPPSAS